MAPSTHATADQAQMEYRPTPPSDDLDPATFLKSVRELSEKREREDAERYRKLEEEVERSRAQRAARRAERERSLSPDKSNTPLARSRSVRTPSPTKRLASPPLTIASARSPSPDTTMNPLPPQPESPTKDIPEFAGFGSIKKKSTPITSTIARSAEIAEDTHKPSPSATSLARSGTLSWQQRRPQSTRGSRPTSMMASSPSSHSRDTSHSRDISTDKPELSRDQIAASLGSRDPSWFKQTADRGVGSPAYRRSNDEGHSTPSDSSMAGRRGLPGLSRSPVPEPERQRPRSPMERQAPAESPKISTPRDSGIVTSRYSPNKAPASSSSRPDLKSLIAQDEMQKQSSPMADPAERTKSDRSMVMSPSQSNLTNSRPSSPTKGMGGFVESAFMKRSESASKRWSAQPSMPSMPDLNRHSSVFGARSGLGGMPSSHSMPKLEPTGSGSDEAEDRVGRSNSRNHAGLTVSTEPSVPLHSRSKSVASNYSTSENQGLMSPPASKRFSPTKSSWIESALTRPESPRAPSPAKNSQPSWMANIAKAKADKASGHNTPSYRTPKPAEDEFPRSRSTSPTKAPFGQGQLKRSDSRDLSAAAPPRSSTPPIARELPPASPPKQYSPVRSPEISEPKPDFKPKDDFKPEPAAKPVQPSKTTYEPVAPKPSPAVKTKPETPPKPNLDFRSNLKPRAPVEQKEGEQPEFLAKFGALRRTKTEKYVAPDFLKGEITRGKADLTKTGGPVKTARRDELKESLLAKKEEMKKAREEGRDLPGQAHERKNSNAPITPSKPEALAKREFLGRNESTRAPPSPEKETPSAVPEALMRHKSMKAKPEPPIKQTSLPVESHPKPEPPVKQTSTPESFSTPQPEKSKLANRFNPNLAEILARGPPSASNSATPSRSASPAKMTSPSEPPTAGAPLQDMRKGRAKGPKKRKGGASTPSASPSIASPPSIKSPSSALSPLSASSNTPKEKPTAPAKSPSLRASPQPNPENRASIPDFAGFGAAKRPSSRDAAADDDKENSSSAAPSKAAEATASFWNRHRSPVRGGNNDQENDGSGASGLSRGGTRANANGGPVKPAKSSRVVSGSLREASPNKSA